MSEDVANSAFHVRNLSRPEVKNEKEALNYLFIGDTNKMMAETPSNPLSSRSHCIFTVYVEVKNNAKVRKSKLHLVDLAG